MRPPSYSAAVILTLGAQLASIKPIIHIYIYPRTSNVALINAQVGIRSIFCNLERYSVLNEW